jgi:hypothetical protein
MSMAHDREEVALRAIGALCLGAGPLLRLEQARVVHSDRRPARETVRELLGLLLEDADGLVAEEEAAEHGARAGDHRHGKIAADWQMARRHAVVRRHGAVPWILGDVVAPHDRVAVERRREDRRVARHRELGERLAGNARDGVERVGLAGVVDEVVEEGAELRTRELGASVGHGLDGLLEIQLGGERVADLVQPLDDTRLSAARLQCQVLGRVHALVDHGGEEGEADDDGRADGDRPRETVAGDDAPVW